MLGLLLWPMTRYFVTAVHEGGHAFFGSAFGSFIEAVAIERSSAGSTSFRTPLGVVGAFVTGLAGYLGPSFFGLVGAILLDDGQVTAVLWWTLAFLALLLVRTNDLFSAFVVLVIGALTALTIRDTSPGFQVVIAYTWVWFLLAGGFVDTIVLMRLRSEGRAKRRPDTGSDAYILRQQTGIAAALWSGVFWLLSLAALIFGAAILLQFVGQQARAAG